MLQKPPAGCIVAIFGVIAITTLLEGVKNLSQTKGGKPSSVSSASLENLAKADRKKADELESKK